VAQVESKPRATSDPEARKRVLDRIKDEQIEFLLLWFTDIEGHLKSFAVTPSEIEAALDDGMGFDGSSITGFNAIEESDMVAIPDPETFTPMPWKEGETKVARMICDVVTPDGQPYEGDPRYVLRRALERMSDMGFETFNVGPGARVLPLQGRRRHRDPRRGRLLRHDHHGRGQRAAPGDGARAGVGRDPDRVRPPRGRPLAARDRHALRARADDGRPHVTYRLIVKEIAKKAGYHATFMPKPIFGENGSGMHTHMSLFTDGRNAFFDGDDKWHLSETGKAFIAGQLRHAREISAVFAQWVNSYKRLVPGYEAPVYVAWSQRNRSALIRIPLYKPGSEQATRAEIRCPDPACNPYLTFATLLHAGLEGIERGYELPEPMETNLYPPHARAAARARDRLIAGNARRGDRRARGLRAGAQGARAAHLRPLCRAEAEGVGRVPRATHGLGARAVPLCALKSCDNQAIALAAAGVIQLTADCELLENPQLAVVPEPAVSRGLRC
jgi:glutamine synthetase